MMIGYFPVSLGRLGHHGFDSLLSHVLPMGFLCLANSVEDYSWTSGLGDLVIIQPLVTRFKSMVC